MLVEISEVLITSHISILDFFI